MEIILEKEMKSLEEEKVVQSRQAEIIIVIGAKDDDKTKQLYEAKVKYCNNVMVVETIEDLYLNYISRFKKVGIIATENASKNFVNKVIEILKNTETEDYIYENSR